MKRILLISGHKSGYNKSKLTGYNEGDLNIELTGLIANTLKNYCMLTVYPYDRDAYEDNKSKTMAYAFTDFDYVLEIHFNAYKDDGNARGTSIQIHSDYHKGISVEKAIIHALSEFGYKLRGDNGITRRNDLLNMQTCFWLGVDYALLETCFYDSPDDMNIYKSHKYDIGYNIAMAIVDAFGLNETLNITIQYVVTVKKGSAKDKNLQGFLEDRGYTYGVT